MKKMTNIVPFFKMSGIRSKKSAIVNPDKFLTPEIQAGLQ